MSRTYSRTSTRTGTSSDAFSTEDQIPRCSGHNRRCKAFVAGAQSKNPGRTFYACPLSRDDPNKCKFFAWADGKPNANTGPKSTPIPAGGRTLGTSSTVPTPSYLKTPPRTGVKSASDEGDIDWSKVDADTLESEAFASSPANSQQSPAMANLEDRLRSAGQSSTKRGAIDIESTPHTPVKRPHLDANSPFVSSPLHPALSPSTRHLEEVNEHLQRQDRLIKAGESAKEGFRKTITRLKEENEALKKRVRDLESQLSNR